MIPAQLTDRQNDFIDRRSQGQSYRRIAREVYGDPNAASVVRRQVLKAEHRMWLR